MNRYVDDDWWWSWWRSCWSIDDDRVVDRYMFIDDGRLMIFDWWGSIDDEWVDMLIYILMLVFDYFRFMMIIDWYVVHWWMNRYVDDTVDWWSCWWWSMMMIELLIDWWWSWWMNRYVDDVFMMNESVCWWSCWWCVHIDRLLMMMNMSLMNLSLMLIVCWWMSCWSIDDDVVVDDRLMNELLMFLLMIDCWWWC